MAVCGRYHSYQRQHPRGAEYVAEHPAEKLEERVYHRNAARSAVGRFICLGIWLIISSTHGAGDIPDNLSPFYEALQEQKPDLSAVRFGAIGIGEVVNMTPLWGY